MKLITALKRVLKWAAISLGILVRLLVVAGFPLFRAIVEPETAKFGTIPDEAKA